MAKTNMFQQGDKVSWRGNIGTVKCNNSDFRYWEVVFSDCTRILHYEDIELHFTKEG